MNKGIIRGLDPNAFALNKPGGVSIASSDLNAVPLTITGENGQSGDFFDVTGFNATAGSIFKIAGAGGVTITAPVAGSIPLVIIGAASQSVDYFSVRNSGGGQLLEVNLNGHLLLGNNRVLGLGDPLVLDTTSAGGSVKLRDNGGSNTILIAQGTVSSVNQVTITSAISTAAPSIAATGTDAAIDLILNSKGAGLVNIGPASASVAVGGGATPPSLATAGIGQAGQPTTAGQNSWLEIKINGTASWIPVWR